MIVLEAAHSHDLVHQGLSHDVGLAVFSLHEDIGLTGMEADTHVAGQGPDGGGPDHEVGLAQVEVAELAQIVLDGELDVDGSTGIILILDLGFCQSGLVLGAPVHGLQALVDVALFVHGTEDLDFLSLELAVHGAVGVFPVGDDAQTLEAAHLALNVGLSELCAGGTELGNGHGLAVELVFLDDGRLDGHAVVVPAGNVGGVVTLHGMGANNEVLQGLVEGVTHVDIAVGEGRAIVQNEGLLILVLFQHEVIDVLLFPVAQHTGFAVGQTCLHGEGSLRGDNGVFVLHLGKPPY